MTVKEMIKFLETMPEDAEVRVLYQNAEQYFRGSGSIHYAYRVEFEDSTHDAPEGSVVIG